MVEQRTLTQPVKRPLALIHDTIRIVSRRRRNLPGVISLAECVCLAQPFEFLFVGFVPDSANAHEGDAFARYFIFAERYLSDRHILHGCIIRPPDDEELERNPKE